MSRNNPDVYAFGSGYIRFVTKPNRNTVLEVPGLEFWGTEQAGDEHSPEGFHNLIGCIELPSVKVKEIQALYVPFVEELMEEYDETNP